MLLKTLTYLSKVLLTYHLLSYPKQTPESCTKRVSKSQAPEVNDDQTRLEVMSNIKVLIFHTVTNWMDMDIFL